MYAWSSTHHILNEIQMNGGCLHRKRILVSTARITYCAESYWKKSKSTVFKEIEQAELISIHTAICTEGDTEGGDLHFSLISHCV